MELVKPASENRVMNYSHLCPTQLDHVIAFGVAGQYVTSIASVYTDAQVVIATALTVGPAV